MVVNSRDDCIIMTIPRYHGDFGFEVAFLFSHCFSTDTGKTQIRKMHELHMTSCNTQNMLSKSDTVDSLLNTNDNN